MFKLRVTFKVLSTWCNTPIKTFFPLLKTVFELVNFDAHWCFCCSISLFVSPFPHWQNTSHWGLFHQEKQTKKVIQGKIRCIGKVGHWGHAVFGQKLLNIQHGVGRCAHKSVIIKWQTPWKNPQKNSLKPNASSPNNTSWHTDTDGLLEHKLNTGSLY